MTNACDQLRPVPGLPTASEIIRNITRYECPRCDYPIPRECVLLHDPNEHELAVGTRRLSVWCPACNGAFQAVCDFSSGNLRQVAPSIVIQDQALVDTLKVGLETVQGDRSMRAGLTRAERAAAEDKSHVCPPQVCPPQVCPPQVPASPVDVVEELDQQIARTEAELNLLRIRQRNAIQLMVAERRTPPAPVVPAADLERLDTDCDLAHAAADKSAESEAMDRAMETGTGLTICPPQVLDRSTSQVEEDPERFDPH